MATTEPALQTTALRERLGRRVREVWIAWAQQQPSPKPSWLVPWDDLGEADKEVDCCIGSAIWADCIAEHVGSIASAELARLTTDSVQEEPTLKEAAVEAEIKRLGRFEAAYKRLGDEGRDIFEFLLRQIDAETVKENFDV